MKIINNLPKKLGVEEKIGVLSALKTAVKSNLVSAINNLCDRTGENTNAIATNAQKLNELNTDLGYEIIKAGYQTAYKYNDGHLKIIYDTPMGISPSLLTYESPYYYFVFTLNLNFPIAFNSIPSCICGLSHVGAQEPFVNITVDCVTNIGFGRVLLYSGIQGIVIQSTSSYRAEFWGRWK